MPRPTLATPPGVDNELRDWLYRNAIHDGRPSLTAALAVATQITRHGVHPGEGGTGGYFTTLITAGFVDATLARVIEPHLDANAILHQASMSPVIFGARCWGVRRS